MIYADSSFTASLYALDGNTARAHHIYQQDKRRPLFMTHWQELELVNTLRLGVYRAKNSKQPVSYQLGNSLKRIQEDLRDGILERAELDWHACAKTARKLSQSYTEKLGVVLLDIWQVACAIELEAAAFWTFDEDQFQLATECGQFRRVIGVKA